MGSTWAGRHVLRNSSPPLLSPPLLSPLPSRQPGPIADFGREGMQEQMITAVPLKNWVVVFSKKDRPRAYEFVNMVKKVCPPLGMVISEPQVRMTGRFLSKHVLESL